MTKASGVYVEVFVPDPVYEHYRAIAERQHLGIRTVIIDAVIDAVPQALHDEARAMAYIERSRPGSTGRSTMPPHRQPKVTKDAKPDDAELKFQVMIAGHRAEVLNLAARGWKANTISAVLRIPYKVSQHIITEQERLARVNSRGRK